jgi:hypothetical protein
MVAGFAVGHVYNRRRDIHDRFGGQRQSGIVTPARYPAVFMFTGCGTRHGYYDEIATVKFITARMVKGVTRFFKPK